MRLLIATLILSACAPGVSVYPGLYCSGNVNAGLDGATLYDSFSAAADELREKCGPMVNVRVESWSGSRH